MKHIAEAEVLYKESKLGYPAHEILAIGHLAQAEAELLTDFPDLAELVRASRKLGLDDFPTIDIISELLSHRLPERDNP
jgi:hypothetical protein